MTPGFEGYYLGGAVFCIPLTLLSFALARSLLRLLLRSPLGRRAAFAPFLGGAAIMPAVAWLMHNGAGLAWWLALAYTLPAAIVASATTLAVIPKSATSPVGAVDPISPGPASR